MPETTTYTPMQHQLTGAGFLAERAVGLLADEPRVGKTGAAIIAADYVFARSILVITTASGRAVWKRALPMWSPLGRTVSVLPGGDPSADVVIVGWAGITTPAIAARLLSREWDLLISDEDHYAKSFDAKRTQALYGKLVQGGAALANHTALHTKAKRVWLLTGTPLPHSPADTYPRLRALDPKRLEPFGDAPDVTRYDDFLHRYCIVRMKRISNFRKIPVVIGGRNLDELKARLAGFSLRRTQQDVGIRAPVYETLPLVGKVPAEERTVDHDKILATMEAGNTRELEMHLGPVRRLTGDVKAHLAAAAASEEMECGLDRLVLAYWHKSVGDILAEKLATYGVARIDGSTSSADREAAVTAFSGKKGPRIFLAQIEAAGEAIDLSAAAELWFVETTFSPRSMKQMSLRITNHTQWRQAIVKVCFLEGSIDEALQSSLMRLWAAIREVLE